MSYIIMMSLFCITLAVSAKDRGIGLGIPAEKGLAVVNTDFHHARIIPVNSTADDVLEEAGQQRWYAFASDEGRLTLELSFDDSREVDYAMYLYRYDSERGRITMIDRMSSSENAKNVVCAVETGIYFAAVSGAFEYDAEHPYTLEVTLSDNKKYGAVDEIQDTYAWTSLNFNITGTVDLNLVLLACGLIIQRQEDKKAATR